MQTTGCGLSSCLIFDAFQKIETGFPVQWDTLMHSSLSLHLDPPLFTLFLCYGASLVAQLVKNLPAIWETWVRSLGWDDPLEKRKATHSSILAWRIPWTVWSSPWGHKESDTTEWLSLLFFFVIATTWILYGKRCTYCPNSVCKKPMHMLIIFFMGLFLPFACW